MVILSKNIPNYAPFSFWKYEDMNLINLATGDALTRSEDGLVLMPKNESDYMDPSQQWILDYNSRTLTIRQKISISHRTIFQLMIKFI